MKFDREKAPGNVPYWQGKIFNLVETKGKNIDHTVFIEIVILQFINEKLDANMQFVHHGRHLHKITVYGPEENFLAIAATLQELKNSLSKNSSWQKGKQTVDDLTAYCDGVFDAVVPKELYEPLTPKW